jgi:LysR family carnitine catabolism transcriptional activator
MVDFSARQLRAFLLAAEHRSFTRAAAALFMTPSGLSVVIRELELQLGFRLFDRTTRYVALTTQGEGLLAVARQSVEEFDAAVAGLGRSAAEAGRLLSIGAPQLIAANILPRAIHEFRTTRPDLRIRLFDANHAVIRQMVEARELDMALGAFFGPAPGIRRVPLFRFSLMVIRAQASASARRASASWSSLQGETFVSLTASSALQQLIDRHLARAGVTTLAGPVVNSLDTQIAMVEAGEGIAVIPSYGLPACRNRQVVMTRLINPVVNLAFSQLRARGRKLPQAAADFTAFLQDHMAQWAGRAGVL